MNRHRSTINAQANFEKSVYAKTCRTNARSEGIIALIVGAQRTLLPTVTTPCTAEIIMFDDVVVVYKFIGDLMFFVTGSCNENELILYTVLQAFHETMSLLLRYVTTTPCAACPPYH